MSIVIICFLLAGYSVQSGSMIYTDVFSSMFGVRGRASGPASVGGARNSVLRSHYLGQLRAHAARHGSAANMKAKGHCACRPGRPVSSSWSGLYSWSSATDCRATARRPIICHGRAGQCRDADCVHPHLGSRIMLGHFDMIAIIVVLLGIGVCWRAHRHRAGHYRGARPLSDDRRSGGCTHLRSQHRL